MPVMMKTLAIKEMAGNLWKKASGFAIKVISVMFCKNL